jgi:hypothetical protein
VVEETIKKAAPALAQPPHPGRAAPAPPAAPASSSPCAGQNLASQEAPVEISPSVKPPKHYGFFMGFWRPKRSQKNPVIMRAKQGKKEQAPLKNTGKMANQVRRAPHPKIHLKTNPKIPL